MTDFNVGTDLPASVDTVEKLAVWALNVLGYLYPDDTVQESSNRVSRVVDAAPFEITFQTPIQWRYIGRVTIPLNRDWQLGAEQLWDNAEELGTLTIPNDFKA